MIVFALSGIFIGTILGIRFSMLALIPAVTCALIIGVASLVMRSGTFGATINHLTVLLAFLQVSYLCGAALKFSFPKQLLSRVHSQ